MSETKCRKCADLRREYGFEQQELRAVARKLARTGEAKYHQQVLDLKASKALTVEAIKAHEAECDIAAQRREERTA